jgi:putative flippase GtrA
MTRRVSRFLTVGALGFVLQLGTLTLLTQAVGWPYEPATALAVALAVLHNFWWHERWTWRDRTATGPGLAGRIARYYVTTGATSIAGNLAMTAIGVELFGCSPIVANVAAVAGSSLANFVISDRWVFGRLAAVATVALCMSPAQASGAEPGPETVAAWNTYVTATERRLDTAGETDRPALEPWGNEIGVPGGAIHDWRGSILIRGVTVDRLLRSLMYPGTPPPQPDVLEARVPRTVGRLASRLPEARSSHDHDGHLRDGTHDDIPPSFGDSGDEPKRRDADGRTRWARSRLPVAAELIRKKRLEPAEAVDRPMLQCATFHNLIRRSPQ